MTADADSGAHGGAPGGAVVELRGLRVVATHGVLAEERARPQPFELDLDVELAGGAAAASDRLDDTVDYATVVAAATAAATGPPRQLLEALAADVADAVLDLPGVAAVTVTVRKLRPPVPADLRSAGVRIRRTAALHRGAGSGGGAGRLGDEPAEPGDPDPPDGSPG